MNEYRYKGSEILKQKKNTRFGKPPLHSVPLKVQSHIWVWLFGRLRISYTQQLPNSFRASRKCTGNVTRQAAPEGEIVAPQQSNLKLPVIVTVIAVIQVFEEQRKHNVYEYHAAFIHKVQSDEIFVWCNLI